MYNHLFGPVPSRRLGMSLGVDLIPHKICSLNCVYCECGATTKLTLDRAEYVQTEDVKRELAHFFENNPDPDYITFSGNGEPTLHIHLGEVLGFIKALKPEVPVAVLTNGTLMSDPGVRMELMKADVVLPSLDAASETALRKINHPTKQFHIENYVGGLIEFRKEFEGEIWLEVFILPGYNDDPENIGALKGAIQAIGPDRVQLNTLDRPGIIDGLRAATLEELEQIEKVWGFENMEIVASVKERHDNRAFRTDTEAAIMETISRRPCTLEDLEKILGLNLNEINKYLGTLEEAGQIETNRQERGLFYQVRKP
ncbi:MAG: radical SAM protein [Bacteroidota bacterium]